VTRCLCHTHWDLFFFCRWHWVWGGLQ